MAKQFNELDDFIMVLMSKKDKEKIFQKCYEINKPVFEFCYQSIMNQVEENARPNEIKH